jgi:ribosomal protein L16 Arg81 hydroxylase
MKRLIFLKTGWKPSPEVRAKAFKQFSEDMKKNPLVKIIKNKEPQAQAIIEFPDDKYQEVYEWLITVEIVEIIDSILDPEDRDRP